MTNKTATLDIPNIDKELSRLQSSKGQNGGSKACLFTLVIYAGEPRRVSYLEEQVNTILDKFPCRIIFIQGDMQSKSSFFRVSVSTATSGHTGNGGSVSCDRIVIETSKDELFRVPYVVIPQLVPDLPVYLLWGENPFEERAVFPFLQSYASRVVFDSECSDNIRAFCEEMETSLDRLKVDVTDINWALLSNWRDMLYQLFDTEEKIDQLADAKSIIISYNGLTTETTKHPEIRALYLQGWLAAAMGWDYRNVEMTDDDLILTYIGQVHPVIIALTPREAPSMPSGAILGIEIATIGGHYYSISRNENLPQVVVHISTKLTCELPFTLSLPNVHRGSTFMKEIFFNKPGAYYRETLKMISKIDYKILCKAGGSDG